MLQNVAKKNESVRKFEFESFQLFNLGRTARHYSNIRWRRNISFSQKMVKGSIHRRSNHKRSNFRRSNHRRSNHKRSNIEGQIIECQILETKSTCYELYQMFIFIQGGRVNNLVTRKKVYHITSFNGYKTL